VLDLPAAMVLVNDPPDNVEVQLRGPKTLATSLVSREVTLEPIPVRLEEGEHQLALRPEMVRAPRGIQVVGLTPQRVRIVLEALTEREVDVVPRVEGTVPPGFVVRRVVAVPPRIRVVGPGSEVRRLPRLRTLPVNVEGQTATFSARVLLEPVGKLIRVQDRTPVSVEVEIEPRRS
jgi:hypothetical protein